jgi:hypothetical protein
MGGTISRNDRHQRHVVGATLRSQIEESEDMAALRYLTACRVCRERPAMRWGTLDFPTNSTPRGLSLLPAEGMPLTLDAGNRDLGDKLSPRSNPGAAIVGNVGGVAKPSPNCCTQ